MRIAVQKVTSFWFQIVLIDKPLKIKRAEAKVLKTKPNFRFLLLLAIDIYS
jgi:hypothetical protein